MLIMASETGWKQIGQMPTAWHESLRQKMRAVGGGRGLDRYILATAALWIIQSDDDELRKMAASLREAQLTRPEEFDRLAADEAFAIQVVPQLAALRVAAARSPRPGRRRKAAGDR